MESGKAQVLAHVAKMGNRTFRASDITTQAGLSRQLVHHHLNSFKDAGWVQKEGRFYSVVSINDIVDALTNTVAEDSSTKRPEARGFISSDTAKSMNELAAQIVYLKIVDIEAYEARMHFIFAIDDTIKFFSQLKKFVNNHQPAISTVRKANNKEFVYSEMVGLGFEWKMPKSQFIETYEDRIDELNND